MAVQQFVVEDNFALEEGGLLEGLTIAYHTYGTLNEKKDNVIWICHALTASSDAAAWWPGMIGPGTCFDTEKYFIVCANILGSCYGTTGPLSTDHKSGKPYYDQFPFITIRDMAKAHSLLRQHLGISKIHLLAGGSMGGYQVLEWCVTEPNLIENIFIIGSSAGESAWGKAIHAAQRMAIETDCTWKKTSPDAGKKGLETARAIGMITYRSYETFKASQEDAPDQDYKKNKAASYIAYQGTKFSKRFNAYSYWYLSHAMDSHNLARGRNKSVENILESMDQKALLIGINSDLLCPVQELIFLANHIKNADLKLIDSLYGHDGFLVEVQQVSALVKTFLQQLSIN